MSEIYQRKITKARQSINESDSVRSIVKSLRENSLKHQLTMNSKIDKGILIENKPMLISNANLIFLFNYFSC